MNIPEGWQKAERPWEEYPIGTKARQSWEGGHWIKTERGWRWGNNGSTFPRPGAADQVMLAAAPTPPEKEKVMADYNEPAMEASWQYLKAQLNPKEWTVSEASNYRGFFAWGWEARRQYDAPAQDYEPVAWMRVVNEDWGREYNAIDSWSDGKAGGTPLYTRPDSSGLRKAAEEVVASIRTEADNVTFTNALEHLRAALEGK